MKLAHVLLLLVSVAAPLSSLSAQKPGKQGKPGKQRPAAEQEPPAPTIPGLRASLVVEPRSVEVGEPMRMTLEIHHPRELVPLLPGDDLGLGPQWVVLQDYGAVAEASPDGIDEVGFWITRKSWQVVALRKAEQLPSMEIFFGEGKDALSVFTSEGELSVASLLDASTPSARPSRTFRDPELPEAGDRVPWWILAPAVTLVLAVGWWLLVRRRRAPKPAPRVAPLDQLDSLAKELPDDLPALQSLHYSLTSLVREATEERVGLSFSGTTDEEWLDIVRSDPRVRGEVEEQLNKVFASAQTVKYARQKPSRYAVEETLSAARGVLETMARVPGGSK